MNAAEHIEWIGLLRSCTAFEAYCKVYTADLRPERVAEFLLLNAEFPTPFDSEPTGWSVRSKPSNKAPLGNRIGSRSWPDVSRLP